MYSNFFKIPLPSLHFKKRKNLYQRCSAIQNYQIHQKRRSIQASQEKEARLNNVTRKWRSQQQSTQSEEKRTIYISSALWKPIHNTNRVQRWPPLPETINIHVHPENDDHVNNDTVDDVTDGTGDATIATGGAATGGAAGGPGTTNLNLRVEQNKIQEFFRMKSKDTILAMDFIRRLEDLAKTNRWTDAQTYYLFANWLRNLAWEWLSSVVDMDDD